MPYFTEKTWPRCPTCGKPADEIVENEEGAVTRVVARCYAHGRETLVIPRGMRVQLGFFGAQLVPAAAPPPIPADQPSPAPNPRRRYGPMGGALTICSICFEEYEMLQDQVTHKPCPGRSATLLSVESSEAKKEPEEEKKTSRFSWLEVD